MFQARKLQNENSFLKIFFWKWLVVIIEIKNDDRYHEKLLQESDCEMTGAWNGTQAAEIEKKGLTVKALIRKNDAWLYMEQWNVDQTFSAKERWEIDGREAVYRLHIQGMDMGRRSWPIQTRLSNISKIGTSLSGKLSFLRYFHSSE